MPHDEMLKWFIYFQKRPVGWRDDDRTMKLLQAQGVKAKPQEIFPSLRSLLETSTTEKLESGQVSGSNLKQSYLFQKLMTATGGDQLPL